MVWYSHLFKNCPEFVVIHTVKGFGIVNKAEVDVFLELSLRTTCIQIFQEAGQVVWYSHLFKNFPQFVVIHTVKGFGVVNKAGAVVFLELSCFLYSFQLKMEKLYTVSKNKTRS